jgi:hypothetical protein
MANKAYHIGIHTANIISAGTDCHVMIKLNDQEGFTHLNTKGNNFQQNDYDAFTIMTEDVGKVEKITLMLDNNLVAGPNWKCNYVVVSSYDYGTSKFIVDHNFTKNEKMTFHAKAR